MKICIVPFFLIFLSMSAVEGVAGSESMRRPKRVYYGTDALITSFPYFAAIETKCGGHKGGGSIISDRFVLSAAHVFDKYMDWGSENNHIEDYPEVSSTDGSPYDSTTTSYMGDYPTELVLNNLVDGPRLDEPSILPSKPDSDNFVDGTKLNARTVPFTESDSNDRINGTVLHEPRVSPSDLLIRAGSDAREKGGSIHEVEFVKIHPDYVQNDGVGGTINDIALVRVVYPFAFDQFRKPISLMSTSVRDVVGRRVAVVGLGETEHELFPNHLKSGTLWITNRTYCEAKYTNKKKIPIAKSAFCAYGGKQGRRDTCGGDSGGPLVVVDPRGDRLAGVLSFGYGHCGALGYPAVYTDVALFISWIERYVSLI